MSRSWCDDNVYEKKKVIKKQRRSKEKVGGGMIIYKTAVDVLIAFFGGLGFRMFSLSKYLCMLSVTNEDIYDKYDLVLW